MKWTLENVPTCIWNLCIKKSLETTWQCLAGHTDKCIVVLEHFLSHRVGILSINYIEYYKNIICSTHLGDSRLCYIQEPLQGQLTLRMLWTYCESRFRPSLFPQRHPYLSPPSHRFSLTPTYINLSRVDTNCFISFHFTSFHFYKTDNNFFFISNICRTNILTQPKLYMPIK